MGDNARYADPQYECDLIMKGGITSGIVYPPAIAEIASDHRLRSIGGTSAGAIAAAAAAAAELGRNSQTGGFARLAALPDELRQVDAGGRTRLFRLFQPQPTTHTAFDLIWSIRKRTGWRRIVGTLSDVAGMAWASWWGIAVAVAALAGVVLLAVVAGPWSLVASIPLFVTILVVTGLVRLARSVPRRLGENFYGLCNGTTPPGADDSALTDWLHGEIQTLAGRGDVTTVDELRRKPVTFGDLADHGVELVVLSTNVSRGTSETIPFRESIWAFDPAEWERLFPDDVVEHLRSNPSWPSDPERAAELRRLGLCPLPEPRDLPIIVAARMSLSFPVLLSAVPLHGLTPQRQADGGWRVTYVRNWFSDGGITSNLPVRLFDAVVPNRPTYGINLSGGADPAADPADNVWRPLTTQQGGLPPTADVASIAKLLGAVFDTMQNWADNDDSRAVGFRDRICTIRLGDGEGGMNLDMPPDRIAGLVARGACAGDNLASIQRGVRTCVPSDDDVDPDIVANQWDRHRWIRFRMAIAGLATVQRGVRARWAPGDSAAPYRDLVSTIGPDEPAWHSYRTDWSAVRSTAITGLFDADPSTIDEAWIVDGAPAGFAVGFGPDRRAGRVAAAAPAAPATPPPSADGGEG